MVECRHCGAVMTSAPSHVEHELSCSLNPSVRVLELAEENGEMKRLLRAVLSGKDVLDNPEWVRRATNALKGGTRR